MGKRKPRASKKSEQLTWYHLRLAFYLFFFTLLFLFYPGNNYYTELFAYNRGFFDTTQQQARQYAISAAPYVINPSFQPAVTAQGVYIIELKSATPIFERNAEAQFSPASTTKVVTALAARDMYELDDVLEVKRDFAVGQTAGLVRGEKLTFESVLYAVLVHSGNDAAYVLADNYPDAQEGDSVTVDKRFMEVVNKKAEQLRMNNSHFINPAGLDAPGQFSTPKDLSLAGRELLKDSTLSKIVSTKSITISDVDYVHFHPLFNINRLLGEIPGVAGLKTGKTDDAGENLITLYKWNGHDFLIVLMKSEDRFLDTSTIVEWIKTNVAFSEAI